MSLPSVAIVVPGLEYGGGVPTVAMFLHRILADSGRYRPELISLATSSRDAQSVRLSSPSSWWRGVRTSTGVWEGEPFTHVGAFLVEFEFQRYRSRTCLRRLLGRFDIVQVVAGAPAWALACESSGPPVGLQVATLVAEERHELLRRSSGTLGAWRRWMTRITSTIERRALARVDAVFVENKWMYDRLRAAIDPGKVIFAPPGVDTDRFSPRESSAMESPYILSVGRFADPRKKIGLLFRAFQRLCESMSTPPRLVLAGADGPAPADWAVADRLGVRDRIEFRERLPIEELIATYRNASLFALSSDEEGLGLVILEAMACGLPVVSTDCGGPTTSVVEGQTGYLVPRGDHEALSTRMQQILEDPSLMERMRRQGRQRAVEQFSLRATGDRFLRWYDGQLERKPGG